jgi:hypothetical protein
MSERGQIAAPLVAVLVLLALGAVLLAHLGGIAAGGGRSQRAADLAALAAARILAADPAATADELRRAAIAVAAANGARVLDMRPLADGAVPRGVEVTVAVAVEGGVPGAGRRRDEVVATARAGVDYSAALPAAAFRPVDVAGMPERAAVVAAAAAQIGWPYVWGGESRAEGGFDCSGLVGHAFAAAGRPLPGRPTAADLWRMSTPIPAAALLPGDLAFQGAPGGSPHHVGMYAGAGTVVVARHAGAPVAYQPLGAVAWDGFGRLLPAGPAPAESAAARAARGAGAPPHVIAAAIELGLADEPEALARRVGAELARGEGLEDALAAALGDRSAAAIVLRRASGPALGAGFSAAVSLLPVPRASPSRGDAAAGPGDAAGMRNASGAAARGPAGRRLAPDGSDPRRGPVPGADDLVDAAAGAAAAVADQLGEAGARGSLQALAAVRNGLRLGLTAGAAFLPDSLARDLVTVAGQGWDAGAALAEVVHTWGTKGAVLTRFGLLAARFTLAGGLASTALAGHAALTARSRRERIASGGLALGSAVASAGVASAGTALLTAGAATATIPPLGLCLMAAGAAICVASYLYGHPALVRGAIALAGRGAGAVAAGARRAAGAVRRGAGTAAAAAADVAGAAVDAGREALRRVASPGEWFG